MDKCKTLKNGTFIPGCMGAAARGKDYCTCEPASGADFSEKRHNPSESSEEPTPVSDTEWLTEYEFNWCWTTDDINLRSRLNALLTRKLAEGKLPVVSKAKVYRVLEEEFDDEYPLAREHIYTQLGITPDMMEGGAE